MRIIDRKALHTISREGTFENVELRRMMRRRRRGDGNDAEPGAASGEGIKPAAASTGLLVAGEGVRHRRLVLGERRRIEHDAVVALAGAWRAVIQGHRYA
jgi:hypothetical protein